HEIENPLTQLEEFDMSFTDGVISQEHMNNSQFESVITSDLFNLSHDGLSDFTLKKSHFKELTVIGQFNNGFILTVLKIHLNEQFDQNFPDEQKSLLIIFDQHACDEIFNYEHLFRTTPIHKQSVLKGFKLKNYYNFIDEEFDENINKSLSKEDGYLTSIPVIDKMPLQVIEKCCKSSQDDYKLCPSKNQQENVFRNAEDLNSEISQYFATKACRMSIMIGQKLNHTKMTEIVRRLAELEKPWNCPHGRPTFLILGYY
ncbi:DNA mismatch repair protein - MLH2/PMS1/Pms2 family, partial [Pseudoloma neurophilia]